MRVLAWILVFVVGSGAAATAGGGIIVYKGPDGVPRTVHVGGVSRPGQVPQAPEVRRIRLWPLVQEAAAQQGLDPHLVDLVIRMESGYNPRAVSPKGASGVMQLMPATAQLYGVKDVFDAVENIRAGTRYLADLLRRFSFDVRLALAAYNAGPEAVVRYNGVPPYPETQNYVAAILGAYQRGERPRLSGGFRSLPTPSPAPVAVRTGGSGVLISNLQHGTEGGPGRRLSLR